MASFGRKHPILFCIVAGAVCGILVLGAICVYDTIANWRQINGKVLSPPPTPGPIDILEAAAFGLAGALPGAIVGLMIGIILAGVYKVREIANAPCRSSSKCLRSAGIYAPPASDSEESRSEAFSVRL